MKKKIKDLTLEEIYRICDRNESCDNCPLIDGIFPCGINNCSFMEDKEIEVDDNE